MNRTRTGVHTSTHRVWRAAVIVAAALLVSSIGAEVLLRLFQEPDRSQEVIRQGLQRGGDPVYVPDPEVGALFVPGREYTVDALDGTYTMRTDHAGFPNAEPWPDQVDVAVLGNSLLVGPGVGMDGQFTTLLQRRLQNETVLNLGLTGGGTGQQLRLYRRFAEPRHPALVIAVFWVTWDIDNSLEFHHWLEEDRPDPDYTHYRLTFAETHRKTGTAAKPSRIQRIVWSIKDQLDRSYVVSEGYRRLKTLLGGSLMRHEVHFADGDSVFLSTKDQQRLARGLARPSTPNIRDVVFQPLEDLREEVARQGGRFLVVLAPSKEEIYGGEDYPPVLRSEREVAAALDARKLPVLDLYPAFRERGREHPLFYRADMHLNARGNEVVADEIARWIQREGVFSGPPGAARSPQDVSQESASSPGR